MPTQAEIENMRKSLHQENAKRLTDDFASPHPYNPRPMDSRAIDEAADQMEQERSRKAIDSFAYGR